MAARAKEPEQSLDELLSCEVLMKLSAHITNKLRQPDYQARLDQCTWTSGESNLESDFARLAGECCQISWEEMKKNKELQNIVVKANLPDISLVFTKGKEKIERKIELKSSQTDTVNGSTSGDLDVNQPLIMCRRPKNKYLGQGLPYIIRYGQYKLAMKATDFSLIVDRTPRITLNINGLYNEIDIGLDENFSCETYDFNWIKLFVQSTQNRIDELSNPINKLSSWQDPFMLLLLLENVKKINSIGLEEYKKGLIDKMNYFIQRNPSYNYLQESVKEFIQADAVGTGAAATVPTRRGSKKSPYGTRQKNSKRTSRPCKR